MFSRRAPGRAAEIVSAACTMQAMTRVRLHVAVVGLDGVDDLFGLLVLAGKVHADGHMAALDLVVDGLAEVVQQAGALGQGNVHAELSGQQARRSGRPRWSG